MPILNRLSIRGQAALAAGFLALLVAVASYWSASEGNRERTEEVADAAHLAAATAAAHLDQFFSGLDTMALAVVRMPEGQIATPQCDRFFAELLRDQPTLSNVVLAAPDGRVLCSAVPVSDAAAHPAVRGIDEVVASRRAVTSEVLAEPVSGRPTLMLAYPMPGGGQPVTAVFGLFVDLAQLRKIFARIPLPDHSVIRLTDEKDRVLATSRNVATIGTTVETVPAGDGSDPFIASGTGGRERVFVSASMLRGPWRVAVGIPTSAATLRHQFQMQRNLGIVIGMPLLVLLILLGAGRYVTTGLERLRLAAGRIAEGDLTPPEQTPMANRELAQAQDALIVMAGNLSEARQALSEQVEQERRMHEELSSLQRQVVRQERLAAVGLLVSGLAHELNNPLQAISGALELLERQADLDDAALFEISFVKAQSSRARDIIRSLSRFSSQRAGSPSEVSLHDVIAEVLKLRRSELDAPLVVIEVETTSRRPVYADATELEQVALHLVINAEQAIEESGRSDGRILIRLSDEGAMVRMEVADNGLGVKASDEAKLFQPFFTTRPVGTGTGLGLSVSYGIIRSYGGTMGYCRNGWGGASFHVDLPAAVDKSARLRGAGAASAGAPATDARTPPA